MPDLGSFEKNTNCFPSVPAVFFSKTEGKNSAKADWRTSAASGSGAAWRSQNVLWKLRILTRKKVTPHLGGF